MPIRRLRLYLAVKEALVWHHRRAQQLEDMLGGGAQDDGLFSDDGSLDEECERREALVWAELQSAFDGCEHPTPVEMVLDCPACHRQHIDAEDCEPHCTHVCTDCGHLWTPAEIPTHGVKALKHQGEKP